MQGTGKKYAVESLQNNGQAGSVATFGGARMIKSISELRELNARWRQIKAGDPERFRLYHGYEARGI
jgi:hypothetical protein